MDIVSEWKTSMWSIPKIFLLVLEMSYIIRDCNTIQFVRYNFCRGSLEEIKQRVRDLYQYWILPNLKDVTPEWEHMTRCLVEPMNFYPFIYMPYKVMTPISTDILNLSMSDLYASLSYSEWIAYKVWMWVVFTATHLICRRCNSLNIR